jgi:hypothetical protein
MKWVALVGFAVIIGVLLIISNQISALRTVLDVQSMRACKAEVDAEWRIKLAAWKAVGDLKPQHERPEYDAMIKERVACADVNLWLPHR